MRPRLVVVAGMSGAGRSTLDAALAASQRRSGQFMPLSLLPSQLATWQSPDPDEPDTHVLNALLDPPALLDAALAALG